MGRGARAAQGLRGGDALSTASLPSRESLLRGLHEPSPWTRLFESTEDRERRLQVAHALEQGTWFGALESVSHGWVAFTSRGYALGRPARFEPYEWPEGAVQEVLALQDGALLRIRWTTFHPDNLKPPPEELRALPGSATDVLVKGHARREDAVRLAEHVNTHLGNSP